MGLPLNNETRFGQGQLGFGDAFTIFLENLFTIKDLTILDKIRQNLFFLLMLKFISGPPDEIGHPVYCGVGSVQFCVFDLRQLQIFINCLLTQSLSQSCHSRGWSRLMCP